MARGLDQFTKYKMPCYSSLPIEQNNEGGHNGIGYVKVHQEHKQWTSETMARNESEAIAIAETSAIIFFFK